jgi:hypothetical protein
MHLARTGSGEIAHHAASPTYRKDFCTRQFISKYSHRYLLKISRKFFAKESGKVCKIERIEKYLQETS